MSEKNSKRLTAPILRIILSISLVLIIAVVVAGFTFAHQWLTSYAIEVGKKNIDAQSSETTIQALTVTEKELEDNTQIREDIKKLRLDDDHPEFAVREILKDIAKRNNVIVTVTNASPTTDSTSTPGTTTPAPEATIPPSASSTSSKTFKLSMDILPSRGDSFTKNSYKDFLQFLRDLEQSLPKVKIDGIEISGGAASASGDDTGSGQAPQNSNNTASVSAINLEVYIK